MTSFKYKPPKIKFLNKIDTLDGMHKTYKTSFGKNREELTQKKIKLENLINEYNKMEKIKMDINDIKKKSQLKSSIELLENEIHDIENNISEIDYYSKTGKILMDYYEIIGKMSSNNQTNENKTIIEPSNNLDNINNINNINNNKIEENNICVSNELENLNKLSQQKRKLKKPTKKRVKYNGHQQNKSILDFFKEQNNMISNKIEISDNESSNEYSSDEPIYNIDDTEINDNNKFKMSEIIKTVNPSENINITSINNNRAELFDKYLNLVDKSSNKIVIYNQPYFCKKCNVDKIINQSEGSIVCPSCGETEYIIIECETSNYKDPVIEKPAYPYKRANHLSEWLASFQAKETTDIPNEVYNSIIAELQKYRITNPKDITLKKMKEILKKLRLHNYYEHTPHIISKITGQPAPTISREMEEKIKSMFNDIQVPFSMFCPSSRINFLSYSYTLHKICQLLELDDFTHCFPLLKSRDKLKIQDSIWKKICNYNSWDFIPSV